MVGSRLWIPTLFRSHWFVPFLLGQCRPSAGWGLLPCARFYSPWNICLSDEVPPVSSLTALVFLCLHWKYFSNLKLHLPFDPSVALDRLLMSQHTWVCPCLSTFHARCLLMPKICPRWAHHLPRCAAGGHLPSITLLLGATQFPGATGSSQSCCCGHLGLCQDQLWSQGWSSLSQESQVTLGKSSKILLSVGVGDKMLVPRVFLLYTASL